VTLSNDQKPSKETLEACPHCGEPLSPWQQVLLSVDRALVCKKCWYRILIGKQEKEATDERKPWKPSTKE
jgi:DNA-directed RNA polymerase subunit RPC12/RpoP